MTENFPLPAICKTCNTVFPSPIGIGGMASVSINNVLVGPCPNGHMNGFVPDGTYSFRDGLMQIALGDYGKLEDLRAILLAARKGMQNPSLQRRVLDEISEFLPPESQAAIKQLRSEGSLIPLLGVLLVIATIAAQIGIAYKAFAPSDPIVKTIVNNNITIVNQGASSKRANEPTAQKPNRKERRKRAKLSRKNTVIQRQQRDQK